MKKAAALALVLLSAVAGLSAQSLTAFENAFKDFAGGMADSLVLDSSIGSTWSDGFVGSFPNFGAGLAVGASFSGPNTATPLFAALGQTAPAALDKQGIPLPAFAATGKIGLPFLPIDIGIKAGFMPTAAGDSLKSLLGVSAEYKNVGAELRFALVRENLILPDVVLGVGATYQTGSIKASMGLGTQTIVNNQSINGHTWSVTASDPLVDLGWTSTTFDGTLQVSKSILFVTPYAGLGYTMGKTSVEGGVSSALSFTRDGGASDYAALASDMAAYGLNAPTLSATGFSYQVDSTSPVFRVYGGVSLNILLVLDVQAMYVPATKKVGGSLTARLQI